MSVHSFNTEFAEEYGINAAIIFYHIVFWIEKNEANETNFHDGHYWTYNSIKAFKTLFPYMGEKQIRNALKKLTDNDLLISGNYNKSPYDRTMWYALTEKAVSILPKGQMKIAGKANENSQKGEPIPDTLPYVKPNVLVDTNVSTLSTETVDVNEYSSQQIVDLYLEICKSLPKTRTLSTNRSKAIKARLRIYGIDAIKEVFQKAEASDFLKGKNSKNWSANLDWLMVDGNFAKVLDGKYDNDRMANYGNGGGNTGYSKQYTQRTSENPDVDCSWIHRTKL